MSDEKPTPQETLKSLQKFLENKNPASAQLAYLKRGLMDDRDAFHRLILGDDIQNLLVDDIMIDLKNAISGAVNDDDGLLNIRTTDLLKDSIGYIKINDLCFKDNPDDKNSDQSDDKLYRLLKNFPGQSHEKVLDNKKLKESMSEIRLIATSINLHDPDKPERLICICRQGGGSVVGKKKRILAFMPGNNYLTHVESVFSIKNTTDFFLWREYIWVINQKSFETTFNYREIAEQRAENVLEIIVNKLNVANREKFITEAKNGIRSLHRAAKLHGANHINKLDVEMFCNYCDKNKIPGWQKNSSGQIELNDFKSTTITRFIDAVSQRFFPGGLDNQQYKAISMLKVK